MRLKVIYTFLLCLFWIANLAAQLPHDFRSEQIFLGVAKTEWAPNDTIEAKGIFYTPFGLSVVKGNPKTTVTPGKYRLLIDVVSPTGITSFERDIVVSE